MHVTPKTPSFTALGLLAPLAALILAGSAGAQCVVCTNEDPQQVLFGLIEEVDSAYLTQSEQNIQMMPDNPAYFLAEDGKDLFHEARGPNNKSLETCDFGQGPGVLEGAYAKMPRYFADTGRVMDLESRLIHCMKTIQGFADDAPAVTQRHGDTSDLMQLQAFVASQSNGYPWKPPMDHPLEKAMRDAGEVLFYRRAGPLDFSCNTCHGATGQRIRASVLPDMNVPQEWTKAISWPARRVGHQQVRSSYHRVRGCYWQMRQGLIKPGSDAAIALMSFWTDAARGQPAILPDLKR
jgi:sulfur-oxidizing protein SoxA